MYNIKKNLAMFVQQQDIGYCHQFLILMRMFVVTNKHTHLFCCPVGY